MSMTDTGVNRLWYRQGAVNWNEALPLGNGRLGAMVFGGMDYDRICLNEDTLWSGGPSFYERPQAKEAYFRARKLLEEGKYAQAQDEMEEHGTALWSQAYMPFGDLLLSLGHTGPCEDFTRSLDFATGVHTVSYACGGVRYTRELLVSAPDQVIALRIRADQPGQVNAHIALSPAMDASVCIREDRISVTGNCPRYDWHYDMPQDARSIVTYGDTDETRGIAYWGEVRVLPQGGRSMREGGGIRVSCADEVTLLLDIRTSFNGWNRHPVLEGKPYREPCQANLDAAVQKPFDQLMADHTADHAALYDRVSFTLSGGEEALLPTDERLYRHEDGGEDPALYALYFNYARYLTIASSRPGTQAMNLQGIWNPLVTPPWNSNYTLNINTEMNYWPTLPMNLPECMLPLVELAEGIAQSGQRTAREFYGAPGFVSHHNTDIWRMTTPVGAHIPNCAMYALWNISSGWLMRPVWEYYEYTGDQQYLQDRAWPLIREAVRFYRALLTQDPQGRYILSPTTSPENRFVLEGRRLGVAYTAAMTQAVLLDVFDICLKAAAVLGIDDDFTRDIAAVLPQLKTYEVGPRGELMEWNEPFDEFEPLHRHISHLYGLHPGRSITPEDTPEWAEACRTSLMLRGDESTGWAMGWRIAQWARLGDGEHTLKLLRRQLQTVEGRWSKIQDPVNIYAFSGGTYLNLLDAHPPFQIDGNFGAAAGIGEMLLQSSPDGRLSFLPALPESWHSGEIRGLRAPGGYHVNILWQAGKAASITVQANHDGVLRLADGRKLPHKAGAVLSVL